MSRFQGRLFPAQSAAFLVAAALAASTAPAAVPMAPLLPLPQPRDTHGSAVVGNFLFLVGGAVTTSWTPTASVLRARVLSPKEIGPWEEATALPRKTLYIGTSVVSHGSHLYVVGGQYRLDDRSGDDGDKMVVNKAFHTTVAADGTLSPWQETHTWPSETGLSCGAAVNGRALYVSGGGSAGDGTSRKVYFAPLDANGTPGNWTETTSLPIGLWFHQMAIHGESAFVFSGRSSSGADGQNMAVFRSRIAADGSLAPWETLEGTNASSTFQGAYTATGNFAFGVGGKDRNWFTVNKISYARLTAEGMGEWQSIAIPNFEIERLAAAASGEIGVLFLTGGRSTPDYNTIKAEAWAVPLRKDSELVAPRPPGCECMLPYEAALTAVRNAGTGKVLLVTMAPGSERGEAFAKSLCAQPEAPGVRRAYLDIAESPNQGLRLGMLRAGVLAEIDATEKVLRRNLEPFDPELKPVQE